MIEQAPAKRNRHAKELATALSIGQAARILPQALARGLRYGQEFPEFLVLCAVALEKCGHYDTALAWWHKVARIRPQRLDWLESALNFAWRHEADCAKAAEHIGKWQKMLENIYSSLPSASLISALSQRGWIGTGCVGIQDGSLKGWLWLPRGESLNLRCESGAPPSQIQIRPVAANSERVLYSLNTPLCGQSFILSLTDARVIPINGSPVACAPAALQISKNRSAKQASPVTIVIPVYDDRVATLGCIASVLASRKFNRTPFELLVVWDHGPDKRLLADLQRLAAKGLLRLCWQPVNTGFLGSVNFALAQIPAGDVILLNSDTITHGDWVDRMAAHAAMTDCATVTAIGNEAEHLSFPSAHERGRIKTLAQTSILDNAARSLPRELDHCEIPVGIGFNMLITRRAIRAIGGLDGCAVFRGYSEEVDYCLRAKEAGLKNYAALNVFTGHLGGRSFGAGKRALAAQNNEVVFKKFPAYRRDYDLFMQAMPMARAFAWITRQALPRLGPMPEVFVQPWSDIFIKSPDTPPATLYCLPRPDGARICLKICGNAPLAALFFDLPNDAADLAEVIAMCGFAKAILSRPMPRIADILANMGLATSVKEHDGDLPPAPASPLPGSAWLAAPPETLAGWRCLCALARQNPGITFYVPNLKKMWGHAPHPANLWSLSGCEDVRPYAPSGFLSPGRQTQLWRHWLEERHGANITIYGAPGDV